MIKCPRCGNELSEEDRLCPFCHEIINRDYEFNNYKKDGFIQLKKHSSDDDDKLILKPKEDKVTYFNLSEMNIFVIGVLFVLIVAAITVFAWGGAQIVKENTVADIKVPVYVPPVTQPVTEKVIENTVKNLSIENLYGSWRKKSTEEKEGYAIPYFSFGENNVAQYNHGSFSAVGSFQDLSEGKKKLVYIELEGYLNGLYEFKVTGNEFDGYKLELTNTRNKYKTVYVSAVAKNYTIEPIKGFASDERLIGEWKTKSGTMSYTFTKDGKMTRVTGNQTMNGVYTCLDKKIVQIKYMENFVKTANLEYYFLNGELFINNNRYEKVTQE